MKMNRIAAAALAGIMLTAPVLAEDAAWTPPTVTQEEMDAVQLGERILMARHGGRRRSACSAKAL